MKMINFFHARIEKHDNQGIITVVLMFNVNRIKVLHCSIQVLLLANRPAVLYEPPVAFTTWPSLDKRIDILI